MPTKKLREMEYINIDTKNNRERDIEKRQTEKGRETKNERQTNR